MKLLAAFLLLSLMACTQESSPEGRSKIRDQSLETMIDSLHQQNKVMLDSIHSLSNRVKALELQKIQ
ncbi:MAG: hypothetical protein EOO88_45095 [Pedobacter sp.]|nr:MAG: hypothetical protein EOO88_45095 [Pedobacter sp.]